MGAYKAGFEALRAAINREPPPNGVNKGLYRFSMLTSFNDVQLGFAPPLGTVGANPLYAVTHYPRPLISGREQYVSVAQRVANVMATTHWHETFGLSFTETMQLAYSDWRRLLALVPPRLPPKPPDPPGTDR